MMIKSKVLAKNGAVSTERNDYWDYYLIRISGEKEASIVLTEEEFKRIINNMVDLVDTKLASGRHAKGVK